MIQGLLGRKVGMTQIFDTDGNLTPVTVVRTGPCVILDFLETPRKKIKIGFENVKESRVSKPLLGFFKKTGVAAMRYIREIDSMDNANYKIGQELRADIFKPGDFVSVTGKSIGKGFQGGMKRWNWEGGPGSHGSMHHRRVGSIGSNTTPGRVNKGKTMPGHMGSDRVTVANLRVMKVDLENSLILLSGSVPGKKNSFLTILISRKKKYQSLDEKKAVHIVKRNPMKQSKKAAGGKGA